MSASNAPTHAVRVQDELREAILAGTLEPGSRLRAERLAERLRTSRTPVREALVLLAREGLVELEPRRGASVRAFDVQDVNDLYEVRALIEPHAAARAATRVEASSLARLDELCELAERRGAGDAAAVTDQMILNDEFHGVILEAAGSARLTAAMEAVAGIPRVFRAAFWRDEHQRKQSLFCHRELLDALRAGRPELADAVMRMHIRGASAFLTEVVDGAR